MSFNRYLYVNNNPYKYNDPNGEFLNFAVKFVADVALNVAVQVATGQDVDLGGALKESALGIVDPTRTIKKAKKLVQALNKGCSFSAETPVLTQDGYKSIIQIEVGDFVLAKNDETGELSWREVTDTFKDWHEETITLTVVDENGIQESIVTTAEHPFYLDNTGWLEAGNLKIDDIVSGPKAENNIRITGIEINNDAQYAYNFTVDTDHTYFVGKTDLWVHNSCNKVGLEKKLANESQVAEIQNGGGRDITGPNSASGKEFGDAARVAEQHGGNASDYQKVSSSKYTASDGTVTEVHGVRNEATGQVVEMKTKKLNGDY